MERTAASNFEAAVAAHALTQSNRRPKRNAKGVKGLKGVAAPLLTLSVVLAVPGSSHGRALAEGRAMGSIGTPTGTTLQAR